ncbi:S2-RNase [Pyrus ussuriensis x Pyrus communis]|uniref:S2-RNase n=1 Tax=Pyrus ussuriensis x Pyrus communis TaxID=2448454 RepID=A0A5N5GEP7_9ROSA|nr:S2-RNase [Pyrus ussuriensis x Pyrus communis]
MVTASQLHTVQSPITSFISTVSTSVTVKLDETNYLVWNFQMQRLLEGHGIVGFVYGSAPCPVQFIRVTSNGSKKMHDRALMQLITATLSPPAISCVIGSTNLNSLLKKQCLRMPLQPPFLTAMAANNSGSQTQFNGKSRQQSSYNNQIARSNYEGSYGTQYGSSYKPFYNKNKGKGKLQYGSKFGNNKPFYPNPARGILGTSPIQANSGNSCQICGKNANINSTSRSMNVMHVNASAPLMDSTFSQQVWLTNSGATNHMTADLKNLSLATPFPSTEMIQTASGEGQSHREDISGISKKKAFLTTVQESGTVDLSIVEPATYKSALKCKVWVDAMKEELDALHTQSTWTLVPLPAQKNIVGCKWVFKIKKNADGSIGRYKARLVAKRFNQEEGIDYGETFSPVVKPTIVRINAFLHGVLQEEVYMSQPPAWNDRFTSFLPSLGLKTTNTNPSLFVKQFGPSVVILLLYVDDIIIIGNAPILIDDEKYVNDLLTKTEMLDSKPCSTPYLPYNRLVLDDRKPYNNPALYRIVVGALQYLTFTRLDIVFVMHQVCQFMQTPMESHFSAVKRILRYLKGIIRLGIRYV